ncbi:MAG: ATP phosphoribosyltransferase [Alphaproteobacteria bacterium]|nr:ATP phosphoribosyltransferase [Alphaproteobacteria bacterium]
MSGRLTLAIPSKGRLQEQTAAFLADCGLGLSLDDGDRGYAARMAAAPAIDVRLMSASEIAAALRDGETHLGVTGEDVLREADPGLARSVLIKPLGFGRADLVVAVPQAWIDVTAMADFADVCADFQARRGRRLRVATKYLRQARAFMERHGVEEYRLVESAGATEGAPGAGAADAIVDITTTGKTLAANGLKIIPGGVILRSQASLVASRTAPWSADLMAPLERMLDIIEARGRAKAMRLLRLAPGPGGPDLVIERAAALGCKVAGAAEGALLELYCPADAVFSVCAALQDLLGGMLGVFDADFIFERPNATFETLKDALSASVR